MQIRYLKFILVFVASFTSASSFAQGNSPTAGGSGGAPFSVLCGVGQVLIGVKGTSGNYISSVQGICASINEILMPVGTGTTDEAGGSGSSFQQRCPSGNAVRGLNVATGWYVDSLRIRCGALVVGGTVSGFNTNPLRAGGGGGNTVSNLDCPNGLPARGLVGRSGSWIDRIGLRCEAAAVATADATGHSPDLRVAIRGYPNVVTSTSRITFRVELWNVGSAPAPSQTTRVDIHTPSGSASTFQQDPNFTPPATCAGSGRCTSQARIPAGRRVVLRVSMAVPRSTEPITVSAQADEENLVAELNETNNLDEQSLNLIVTGL